MRFDHVALSVQDIARSVAWYVANTGASIVYQDETWAMLEVDGAKIALTLPQQHPPHLAFDVGPAPSEEFLNKARVHRDGSISRYVVDPDGNAVEWIHYPEKGAGS
jgi:catechol 2,3-dioxygenase-like lactoylglutathione lyase family enzyme